MRSILHKLIIALFSGFAEFFSVPAFPHLMLYEVLTGTDYSDPQLSLGIHLGALLAVIFACNKRLLYLIRSDRQERNTRRRRNRHLDMNAIHEVRMLKAAMIPVLISLFFYHITAAWVTGVAALSLTLVLNGFLLFLPRILPHGNKDSRMMSPLDSLIMSLGGVLAMIPGISRINAMVTAGILRGGDQTQLLEYSLLVSVPVLVVLLCIDIYAVVAAGATITALMLLTMVLAAVVACGSGYLGIMFMRFLFMKAGYYSICYYSWGMALFSFVLYLLI